MKCLIGEDESTSRMLLHRFLLEVGECHAATNGRETVEAFKTALDQGEFYDLVCLDIMMPEMDGHQVLQAIRQLEGAAGIDDLAGVKVIMITAMHDSEHVLGAFRLGCDAYIVKPVLKSKLFEEMGKLGLFAETT